MKGHLDWSGFFGQGIRMLRKIIRNGITSGAFHLPPLDPLLCEHFNRKVKMNHPLPVELDVSCQNNRICGLKVMRLNGEPHISLKKLHFSLITDELTFESEECKLNGFYELGTLKRSVSKETAFTARLQKLSLTFTFTINLDSAVVIESSDVQCKCGDVTTDLGDEILSNIFKDYFVMFFGRQINQLLAGVIENYLAHLLENQRDLVSKIQEQLIYKMENGGWKEGQVPRILQGFNGIGELPVPKLWELPKVQVKGQERIALDELVLKVKTGDLLLFSGVWASSKRIRRLTQSPFSHVAMVVKEPDLANGKALLWQSSAEAYENVLNGENESGVQVSCLASVVRQYFEDGEESVIVWRTLSKLSQDNVEKLMAFIKEKNGDLYPPDREELYIKGLFEIEPCETDLYSCSGLVAESMMKMGILRQVFNANQYAPRDFSYLHECLPFTREDLDLDGEVIIEL